MRRQEAQNDQMNQVYQEWPYVKERTSKIPKIEQDLQSLNNIMNSELGTSSSRRQTLARTRSISISCTSTSPINPESLRSMVREQVLECQIEELKKKMMKRKPKGLIGLMFKKHLEDKTLWTRFSQNSKGRKISDPRKPTQQQYEDGRRTQKNRESKSTNKKQKQDKTKGKSSTSVRKSVQKLPPIEVENGGPQDQLIPLKVQRNPNKSLIRERQCRR
eukprot:TRINITY_DN8428_c0_g1_i10.p1 TRINITY_DN8428_c0_g1~~TRINITY_DN8428_c0_g1_i10.p1  ORF type:complete len:218 (-),score=15.26 TRINITY_DN8428_c0_g1_i10:260-913(-)